MPDPAPAPRGERLLVRHLAEILRTPASGPVQPTRNLVGFGDDMAALDPGDASLLWTVDMLMDGVDFDSNTHDWVLIGRKAMAVNLSDCAAMAAQPIGALCAVALERRLSMAQAEALLRGAHEMGLQHGCPIVGGDTNSWAAPTVVSITIAARMPAGLTPVRRSGARAGDRIWISGPCGGSILGRHLTFEPRIALGIEVARRFDPHAMIDISDGIAIDLDRICEASGCGACIHADWLGAIVHRDASELAKRDGRTPQVHALTDGEDFELLIVLAPTVTDSDAAQLGLLPLGEVVAGSGLTLRHPDGRNEPLAPGGWEHFA